jgi:hypothetical protein
MTWSTAAVRLGEKVKWRGCVYVLRGFEPMSVPERRAQLEDPVSKQRIFVSVAELEGPGPGIRHSPDRD